MALAGACRQRHRLALGAVGAVVGILRVGLWQAHQGGLARERLVLAQQGRAAAGGIGHRHIVVAAAPLLHYGQGVGATERVVVDVSIVVVAQGVVGVGNDH